MRSIAEQWTRLEASKNAPKHGTIRKDDKRPGWWLVETVRNMGSISVVDYRRLSPEEAASDLRVQVILARENIVDSNR